MDQYRKISRPVSAIQVNPETRERIARIAGVITDHEGNLRCKASASDEKYNWTLQDGNWIVMFPHPPGSIQPMGDEQFRNGYEPIGTPATPVHIFKKDQF